MHIRKQNLQILSGKSNGNSYGIKNPRRLVSSPLLIGTFFLTASGVISRLLGFFYRIFLSRTIGAEALGLYHLAFPIIGLMFSVSASGIQTALSRYIAEAVGSASGSPDGEKKARRYLAAGLFYSGLLSLLCCVLLYFFSDRIALYLLGDIRCGQILTILSYSLLPSCIHSCINGYYYGKKKALVPSVCQLAEQLARVAGVYLLYLVTTAQGQSLTAVHAAWGLVIGELCGLLVSVTALSFASGKSRPHSPAGAHRFSGFASRKTARFGGNTKRAETLSLRGALRAVGVMAIPLTANQALIHLCSSVENLLIPLRLQHYGYSSGDAMEMYGVLSGMAISVIFFPGVLTNSLSVLLLPSISEANAQKKEKTIRRTVSLALYGGLSLGFLFTFLFLTTGDYIGNVIFQNALAGVLIRRLSWICPLMYVSGLLNGILHGLGAAKNVLFINLLSSGIRIGIIFLLVPAYGLSAVLWGMLLSQLFAAAAAVFLVYGLLRHG